MDERLHRCLRASFLRGDGHGREVLFELRPALAGIDGDVESELRAEEEETRVGEILADHVREAALGGLLHDMGKALLPQDVLNKPGKLTDEEFAIVRQHPVHGERLLREGGIGQEAILHIARHHHEKFNGAGYPAT